MEIWKYSKENGLFFLNKYISTILVIIFFVLAFAFSSTTGIAPPCGQASSC